VVLGAVLAGPGLAAADAPAAETDRLQALQALSLEDLVVTSVSRKEENAFRSAAAVTVLPEEEIRRSGVRSIPEALRLATGVQVGRLTGSQWAVSTRGFADRFANKLLVLTDGRAVYNPAFGGVYWNVQDYLLEDLERIEVVRGPGGTLWGANAVNGVVSILTKDARDTQGTLAQAGYGTAEQGFLAARHGFRLGENGHVRVFGKYDNQDTFEPLPGEAPAHDDQRATRAGLRADWHLPDDHFTLQGEYYYAIAGGLVYEPTFTPPHVRVDISDIRGTGGHVLGRWTRSFATAGELQVQAYYDRLEQDSPAFEYALDTFDLAAQHRLPLPWRQELVYGLGYRLASDETGEDNPNRFFVPAGRNQQLFSAFAQDEITLAEDRLRLIAGTKLEHHDYIGWQVQPNVRLAWTPDERHTVWAAVSRAVRSPSRTERDIRLTLLQQGTVNGLPLFPRGYGSFGVEPFGPEVLHAYELGWRVRPLPSLTFDLTGFYFDYDDLGSAGIGTPFLETGGGDPRIILPLTADNGATAESAGFEAAAEWAVTEEWRLRAGYSLLHVDLDTPTFAGGGRDPDQQWFLRSSLDLPGDVQLDAWARYVDGIPGIGIGAYFDVDLRVAWQATDRLEVAVVGQNLCSPQRQEFLANQGGQVTQTTQVPRGVYGQVTLRF
jgi:iron complex outermembrane receptor protein